MDHNSNIILYLLYRRRKRRRNRLHWVHPIIQKREEFGAFYALFGELRDDAMWRVWGMGEVCTGF